MQSYLFLTKLSVLMPDPGLIFWASIIFLGLWYFVGKKAIKPIQEALKQREVDIQNSLDEAKKAREDVEDIKAANERILAEAREERSNILKEAKEAKDNIIKEAREKAKEDAKKIVMDAKQQIENQKMAAITDLKNQSGLLAIDIAEQLLRKDLKSDTSSTELVGKLIKEAKWN